jgi:class 3 adenylate cyclase/tetratricopeptide (TPR) repeat protein
VSACPNCGEQSPEGFKFCPHCGSPMDATSPPQAEERKVVTVLFCDLVGFTGASEATDPEDVKARLRPYHAMLRREIERFGGQVEKFIGDAVMAVFGVPLAKEDDAERAVRASLRIVEAIEELNASDPRLELKVRLGINTGEALVDLAARMEAGEGVVAGDTVNTASRLQGAASEMGVAVGAETWRATRDRFEYIDLGSVTLKGKSDLVRIWSPIRPAGRGLTDRSPFIGRETELGALDSTFEEAATSGTRSLIVIGEPGVGKSRLLLEFAKRIERRQPAPHELRGRCLAYGEGIAFWALGEIVKLEAGILENDSRRETAAKLRAAVERAVKNSLRDWVVGRLCPLVGLESEATGSSEETFAAWRAFLLGIAARGPLMLIVEDLHWADPALLAFFQSLIGTGANVPLFVLGTARPEFRVREPSWAPFLELADLAPDDTSRLITALAGKPIAPASMQVALLERTGGNPLFAEQLVRMLRDRGLIHASGRVDELPSDLPTTLRALLAARLDGLAPERKALLHDASVVGRVFWSGAVAALGLINEASAQEHLDDLGRLGFVRPAAASSVAGTTEYAFWHALTRDVAYGAIPRRRRLEKHIGAARWIERMAGERPIDVAEIVAFHYQSALDLARAIGREKETPWPQEEARRWLVMAGDRSMGLDVRKAAGQYRRALELYPSGHPDRGQAAAKLAGALAGNGQFAEAQEAWVEAIDELTASGRRAASAEARIGLSDVFWHRGDPIRSGEELETAIAVLETEPPGRELIGAYLSMESFTFMAGRPDQAIEWADKALSLIETLGVGVEQRRPYALAFRGVSRCSMGDVEGMADLRLALAVAENLHLTREIARVNDMLAELTWAIEGPKQALELFQEAAEVARRTGSADMEVAIRSTSLGALFDLGRWDEVLEIADQVIEWSTERGGSYYTPVVMSYQAGVLAHRGEAAAANALVEGFLPDARRIGEPQVLVPALAVASSVRRLAGDPAGAIGLVEEIEWTSGWQSIWFLGRFLPDMIRACIAADRKELAERILMKVDRRIPMNRLGVLFAEVLLDGAREGSSEALAERFADVADRWGRFGSVLEHAEALYAQGECLLRIRRADAARPLRDAAEALGGLGADRSVAEVRRSLAQALQLHDP